MLKLVGYLENDVAVWSDRWNNWWIPVKYLPRYKGRTRDLFISHHLTLELGIWHPWYNKPYVNYIRPAS